MIALLFRIVCYVSHAKLECKLQAISQIWNCHSEWITFKESKHGTGFIPAERVDENKIFYITHDSFMDSQDEDMVSR